MTMSTAVSTSLGAFHSSWPESDATRFASHPLRRFWRSSAGSEDPAVLSLSCSGCSSSVRSQQWEWPSPTTRAQRLDHMSMGCSLRWEIPLLPRSPYLAWLRRLSRTPLWPAHVGAEAWLGRCLEHSLGCTAELFLHALAGAVTESSPAQSWFSHVPVGALARAFLPSPDSGILEGAATGASPPPNAALCSLTGTLAWTERPSDSSSSFQQGSRQRYPCAMMPAL